MKDIMAGLVLWVGVLFLTVLFDLGLAWVLMLLWNWIAQFHVTYGTMLMATIVVSIASYHPASGGKK